MIVLGDDARLSHGVQRVAFTPDGAAVWCIGRDGASLVDATSLEVLRTLAHARYELLAAHAGGRDPSEVTLLDASGALSTLAGERLGGLVVSVGAAVFSRDGAVMVTSPPRGEQSPRISVWRTRPHRLVRAFAGEQPLAVSADGSLVAHGVVGWKGRGVAFTRVSDGVTVRRSMRLAVSHLALADDGAAACATADELVTRCPCDPAERIESLAAQGVTAFVGATPRGVVRVASLSNGAVVSRDGAPISGLVIGGALRAALSPAGDALLGVDLGVPYRVDLDTGFVERASGGHDGVRDLAWSPDGALLVTVARDGSCRVWSANDGSPLARWEGAAPGDGVAVAWSRDGATIFVRGGDGALSEWSLGDESLRRRWPLRPPRVREGPSTHRARARSRMELSPDGGQLAVLDAGLAMLALDTGALRERDEVVDFAWRDDQAAVIVTLESTTAAARTRWRVADEDTELGSGTVHGFGPHRLAVDGQSFIDRAPHFTGAFRRHPFEGERVGDAERLGIVPINVEVIAVQRDAIILARLIEGRTRVERWVAGSPHALATLPAGASIERATLSPDGDRLAVVLSGRAAVLSLSGAPL